MIVKIPLDKIIIPQGLLPRIFGVNEEKVEEYAEAIENGAEFPPIKVWKKPDGTYQVIDGVHRISAYRKLGRQYIEAEIVEDIQDEIDFMERAIQENLKHGLPLSREDKREDARRLYLKGRKPESIAKLFKVSLRTVYNWIGDLKQEEKLEKEKLKQRALELYREGYTQEEIAEELGVSQKTISNWLASLEKIEEFQNLLKQKALELYREGYTQEEIAKELGVSRQTISYWINSLPKNENFQNLATTPQPPQEEPTSEEETEEYDGSWDDWNEEEETEAEPVAEEKPKSKPKKEPKKLLHPNQILERCKTEIWDAVIEIEFRLGEDKALEVLEEIYFAYKERKHKGLTIYKDIRARYDAYEK